MTQPANEPIEFLGGPQDGAWWGWSGQAQTIRVPQFAPALMVGDPSQYVPVIMHRYKRSEMMRNGRRVFLYEGEVP